MKNAKNPWFNFLLSEKYTHAAVFFLRLFIGLMLMRHGIEKIQNFDAMKGAFPDPIGLGGELSLIFIILAEIGASLLLILGLMTRFALLPLIFALSVAAFIVHSPFSIAGSELPLLYIGVYMALFMTGPGKWSVDHLLGKTFGKEDE